MLANEHGYEFVEVNPAYSSVIGNFEYGNENTPDSIAASIEIARRAHKKFQKGWLIPAFNIHCLDEQWKQTLGKVGSWKVLSNKIKKTWTEIQVPAIGLSPKCSFQQILY